MGNNTDLMGSSFFIGHIVHFDRADRPTCRADRREDLQARGRIVYNS